LLLENAMDFMGEKRCKMENKVAVLVMTHSVQQSPSPEVISRGTRAWNAVRIVKVLKNVKNA